MKSLKQLLKALINIRRFFLGQLRKLKLFSFNKNKITIGRNFYCGKDCFVSSKNIFIIGDNFYMGSYCHLAANSKIGNDVLLASFVSLVGGDHKIDDINTTIREAGRDKFKPIEIEDNVWIGHGVIVMHGVKIFSGAVVAAGSVVTKNIPRDEIWGGVPAKFIRKRKKK